MLYVKYSDNELRSICRTKIESLEHNLRRIIDYCLTKSFGDNYFDFKDKKDNYIINSGIKTELKKKQQLEPTRFPRLIDATFLEDQIDIICNPNLYKTCFRNVFQNTFPQGNDMAREIFNRLKSPRNHLSHANSISLRDVERVVCYSNDIIDSIKFFFISEKMEAEYNVPTILKILDSFGNVFHCDHEPQLSGGHYFNPLDNLKNNLRPGDLLTLEIDIDASYQREDYEIYWKINGELTYKNETKLILNLETKDVATIFDIHCYVKTNKDWHKHSLYDDTVTINYKVLPPL